MSKSYLKWIALAGALLAPVSGYAQTSCSRESLKSIADLYVDAQTAGFGRPSPIERPQDGAMVARRNLAGLPVFLRVGYVENFDMISGGRLVDKPLQISKHRSLLDAATCETFTEAIVSDPNAPYALGTRLRFSRGAVTEIETTWTTKGYWGFDVDTYLKATSTENWGDIPEDKRDTRKVLQKVADSYLDALILGKADVEPWGLSCKRTAADGSCQVGVPIPIVNITNRHYVIDETIGAIAVICTFGVDPASGRIRTPDAHVFRVEGGKVRFVHALMHLRDESAK